VGGGAPKPKIAVVTCKAMARAARSLGRPSLADLIQAEQLSPRGVCRLFGLSLAASSLADAALIITAALVATGDYWSEEDRDLALSLVGSERFCEIIERARAFERS
jgi:hypothetical protein